MTTNNAQIEATLISILRRLEVIEGKLGISSAPKTQETTEPSVEDTSEQTAIDTSEQLNARETVVSEYMKQYGAPATTHESSGGKWLGIIGVFFFILAAGSFISLAIDSGWLTPERQFGGALLFGGLLVGLGYTLQSRDIQYVSLLPAAGIVVFFMTAFAGHLHFRLYGGFTASVLAGCTAFGALYLAARFKHDLYLVTATIGTYLVPLLIYGHNPSSFSASSYFILWDILFCVAAIQFGKRILIALTAYLGIGIYALYTLAIAHSFSSDLEIVIFQALQFVLFATAVGMFSVVKKQPLTSEESWTFFPVLLLFYTIEYALLVSNYPSTAPWISLGFAAIVFGIYFFAKMALQRETLASAPMVATFIGMCALHSIYLEMIPGRFGGWFAVVLMALYAFGFRKTLPYERYWPVHFLFFGVVGIEYLKVLDTPHYGVVISSLFALGFFYAYWERRGSVFLLILSLIQALAGLGQLSMQFAHGSAGSYLTSGLWGVFALLLLLIGQNIKDQSIAKCSLYIFGLVAFKVFFIDMSGTSNSLVKIIALIVIGGLLYAGGLLFRKISQWEESA